MSFLANSLIRLYGGTATASFDRATKEPREAQAGVLADIVKANANCAFGKAHGFATIRTESEFKEKVPVREFEGFRPFVQQILSGEKGVLTAVEPVRFNLTSGTTGEPKYIPITRQQQNQELNLIGQWYYRSLIDHPRFLDHSRVAIVSPAIEGQTAQGIPFGSASGMMFDRIPHFFRRFYGLIDQIPPGMNYDDKYYLIARCALEKDVSFIMTPNPSTLIRLAEVIVENAEQLIRAIYDGNVGRKLDRPDLFPPDRLKSAVDRARSLESTLNKMGMLRPSESWPHLKLIACWLGGSAGTQANQISSFYGHVPIRDIGYMASEAHITLPFQDHTPSGILAIQANHYEFIPEEAHGTSNPSTLSCHELEPQRRYAIVLTTRSGLYRYDINDIVEVTGFYHRTPILAFCRKGRDMTNITGEKMHANHFLMALDQARRRFCLSFTQLRAVPDFANSRYVIHVEFIKDVSDEVIGGQVLPFIDQALQKLNIEYGSKRASARLKPPSLALMRRGWSESECRRFMQSGKRIVQFKWRTLCSETSPEDTAAVLKTIETERGYI